MKYIQAAVALKKLIESANLEIKEKNSNGFDFKNAMFFQNESDEFESRKMADFTNEFVNETLKQKPETKAFVITDVATNEIKHRFITYFLYKGYHKSMEKGLFFFQMVNPKTMAFEGGLQFSNLEENIFLKPKELAVEESTCNALETDNHNAEQPEIAFIIGNVNEERLAYDIERLIVDTAFNTLKNSNADYRFILQISRYGNSPSIDFENKLKEIEKATKELTEKEFKNVSFRFDLEKQ